MTNVATRFQPDISGSAVPSGFVGQVYTFGTWSGTTLTSNTDIDFNNVGTIEAGQWLIWIEAQTANTAAGTQNIEVALYSGTTVSGGTLITGSGYVATPSVSGRDIGIRSWPSILRISSTTSISFRLRSNSATNTLYASTTTGRIVAIRQV